MEILSVTDDGKLVVKLTEEEQRLLIQKAINDILREEIKKHESAFQSKKLPSKHYDSPG